MLNIALLGSQPKQCEIFFFPKTCVFPFFFIALQLNFCFGCPTCAYFLIHWRILKKEGKNIVSHLLVHHDKACLAVAERNYLSASPLVRHGEARFSATRLGPNFLVRSSETTFAAARLILRRSEPLYAAA